MMMVLIAIIGLNGYLYLAIPKTFFPQQDTGMIQGGVSTDQSMSFTAMTPKLEAFAKLVQSDPAVATVTASIGSAGGGVGVALSSFLLQAKIAVDKTNAKTIFFIDAP